MPERTPKVLPLEVFGVPVTLHLALDDPPAVSRLRWLLRDLIAPPAAPASDLTADELSIRCDAGKYLLVTDHPRRVVANAATVDQFAAPLLAAVLRTALDRDPDRAHLHAAAVAAEGTATLIVGPSGSGKSSLCAGLVAADWSYLSDECVAVNGNWVSGYRKPLSVAAGIRDRLQLSCGVDDGEKTHLPASAVGTLTDRAPVDAIVCVHFDSDAPAALVTPLSLPEVVYRSVLDCVDASRLGGQTLRILVAMASRTRNYLVAGSDLDAMVTAVRQLDRGPVEREPAEVLETAAYGEPYVFARADGGVVGLRVDGRRIWLGASMPPSDAAVSGTRDRGRGRRVRRIRSLVRRHRLGPCR